MTFILEGIEISLLLVVIALAVPVVVLAVEIGAAVMFKNRIDLALPDAVDQPRIAVLIPAHNEGEGVLATLQDVLGQLGPSDRCLVVADNCDDETANVVRGTKAEVIERQDVERRGKGYALDFGVRHLTADPPDIVIMVDADCRVREGTLIDLAHQAMRSGRPCQSRYIMDIPDDPSVRHRIAAFAWIVKTYVRPLGLTVMGVPCGLMGTGMAFPWTLIVERNLATDHIVEDALFGLQFAADGNGALFCPQVDVRSTFPATDASMDNQSTRWEHGSLLILTQMVPGLMRKSMRSLDWRLMLLALDALVPPLSGLVLIIVAYLVTTLLAVVAGSVVPFIVGMWVILVLLASLFLAWYFYGHGSLRSEDILKLPAYIFNKAPRYLDFVRGKTSVWIRTHRD